MNKSIVFDTPEELKRLKDDTLRARIQALEIIYSSFKNRDITNLYQRSSTLEWEFTIGENAQHECMVSVQGKTIEVRANQNSNTPPSSMHTKPGSRSYFNMEVDNHTLLQISALCEGYKVYSENADVNNVLGHLRNSPFARGVKIDELLREMEEETK